MSLIAFAIPVFFLFIGIELFVAHRRNAAVYRFGDSISDLSCGIVQQVVTFFLALVTVAGYKFLYVRFGLFEIQTSWWWAWVVCFIGVDFCYYWFHRLSHEVGFLWGAHVVHHQSEEYNLTVALRQSAFQPGFSWLFYLPLALIGFPPLMFFVLASVNTLYQFWIHTRLIDRMGAFEWVFNTPSHHRVHHGRNTQYIDRNHGGTLIVWDRLFGTFEPEGEEVIYGVNDALDSYNPVWANFHFYVGTWQRARTFPRLLDRIKVWFMLPGWTPEGVAKLPARELTTPKYDPIAERDVVVYVLVQFTMMVFGTVGYLFLRPDDVGFAPKILLALTIVVSVMILGGLVEGRRWARYSEYVRPVATVLGVVYFLPQHLTNATVLAPAVLYALVSVAFVARLRSLRSEPSPVIRTTVGS